MEYGCRIGGQGSWLGDIEESQGASPHHIMDVIRELRIFCSLQHEPIERDLLLAKWKSAVGDTFESLVSLALLAVSVHIPVFAV